MQLKIIKKQCDTQKKINDNIHIKIIKLQKDYILLVELCNYSIPDKKFAQQTFFMGCIIINI